MTTFLQDLAYRRDTLIGALVTELRDDTRVQAAWLGGSHGRGTSDEWSDIDLFCTVKDAEFAQWLVDRRTLYARIGEVILTGPELPAFGSDLGIGQSVMFAGPVSLDWEAWPQTASTQPPDIKILFERVSLPVEQAVTPNEHERTANLDASVGFFWAMTPIALKYVGRRATLRAVAQIDLLRNSLLRTWRLLHAPDRLGAGDANWLHPKHDQQIVRWLPNVGSRVTPGSALATIQSLMDAMKSLDQDLKRAGRPIPVGAIAACEKLARQVATLIEGSDSDHP